MIIDDLDKVPTYKHFAILTEKVVYRSREYDNETYSTVEIEYDCYTSQAEWEDMIRRYAASGKRFRALQVSTAQVQTSITIAV